MTTVTTDQLLEMAQTLAPEQRRELAGRIVDIVEDDEHLDDEWVKKMRGRMDDVRSGRAELLSGEQVRERIAKQLAENR